jgi:hypothetical protein
MPEDLNFFTGFPGGLVSGVQRCFNLTWLGPSYNIDTGVPNLTNICQQENDYCVKNWVVTRKHTISLMSVASFNASVASIFKI